MSQTQAKTPLLSCRWGWCTFTTTSASEFTEHVLDGHVENEPTIKRSEVAAKRRAEEGYGDSFSAFAPSTSEGGTQARQNPLSPIVVRSNSNGQEQLTSPDRSLPLPPAGQPPRKFADLSSSNDSSSSQSEEERYQSPALDTMISNPKRGSSPFGQLDLSDSSPSSQEQEQEKAVEMQLTQDNSQSTQGGNLSADWLLDLPEEDDPVLKSIGDLTVDPAFLANMYESQQLAFQTQAPYHSQSSMYDEPV